jgi:menaquinone-specific isochorismate synthase
MAQTLDESTVRSALAKLARIDEIRFYSTDDYKIAQYEVVLDEAPPIETLIPKAVDWSMVWKPKNSESVYVGLGALLHFSYLDVLRFPEELKGLRVYGGTPFPSEKNRSWLELNQSRFFLPKLEWVITDKKAKVRIRTLVVGNLDFDEIKARLTAVALHGMQLAQHDSTVNTPEVSDAVDSPDFGKWGGIVARIKGEIDSGRVGKIVLGRSKNLKLRENCDFGWVCSRLLLQKEPSYMFALQTPSGMQFFGRSPERFLAWDNERIFLDALAGTSLDNTAESARNLQSSEKDRMEHGFVTMFIEKILHETCSRFEVRKNQEVLKLAHVQHLASEYAGYLKPGVHPVELMGLLYPNPAVGGYPKTEAVSFLNAVEPLERGWYTGIIGWTDGVQGDFALGIRSALAFEKNLRVFGGAGIVSDSDAGEEWRETGMKMKNMLELFGYNHE